MDKNCNMKESFKIGVILILLAPTILEFVQADFRSLELDDVMYNRAKRSTVKTIGVQDSSLLCGELCGAGFGWPACGVGCSNYINFTAATLTYAAFCPKLCEYNLGGTVCVCPSRPTRRLNFDPVCIEFCTRRKLNVPGCFPCQNIHETESTLSPHSTNVGRTTRSTDSASLSHSSNPTSLSTNHSETTTEIANLPNSPGSTDSPITTTDLDGESSTGDSTKATPNTEVSSTKANTEASATPTLATNQATQSSGDIRNDTTQPSQTTFKANSTDLIKTTSVSPSQLPTETTTRKLETSVESTWSSLPETKPTESTNTPSLPPISSSSHTTPLEVNSTIINIEITTYETTASTQSTVSTTNTTNLPNVPSSSSTLPPTEPTSLQTNSTKTTTIGLSSLHPELNSTRSTTVTTSVSHTPSHAPSTSQKATTMQKSTTTAPPPKFTTRTTQTTVSTTPDWDELCEKLCRIGEGGAMCRCDLLPLMAD